MTKDFEPFQKVLVRLQEREVWKCAFYDRKGAGKYHIVIGPAYDPTDGNILPYNDETKHLLGTKNDPAPKWEPKPDELVAVCHIQTNSWAVRIFSHIDEDGYFVVKEWVGRNVPNQRFHICEPLRDHFNVPD